MYKYVLEHGTYYLTDDENGEILAGMDEVAIALTKDPEMWTLLKHGSKENVQKWYNGTYTKYMQHGLKDIARDMVMICGKFPVEELNRCLDTTGYIKRMVEKLGLLNNCEFCPRSNDGMTCLDPEPVCPGNEEA